MSGERETSSIHRSFSRSAFDSFRHSHGGMLRASDHNPSFLSRAVISSISRLISEEYFL